MCVCVVGGCMEGGCVVGALCGGVWWDGGGCVLATWCDGCMHRWVGGGGACVVGAWWVLEVGACVV